MPPILADLLDTKVKVAFERRHGINIMWPFLGPLVVDPNNPSTTYRQEPFVNPSAFPAHVTADVLERIKVAGFDFIRLNIAPGPWMEAIGQPTRLDYLFGLIDEAAALILRAGLGVVIDLHPSNYVLFKVVACLDGGPLSDIYGRVVGLFAERYASWPKDTLALSLFNEPPDASDFTGHWPTMQAALYRAARALMRHHTLILTADGYASIATTTQSDPRIFDDNTLWDVHPYEPPLFCSQGNPDFGFNKHIRGLEYPPKPAHRLTATAAMLVAVNADFSLGKAQKSVAIASNARNLDFYFMTPFNAAWIDRQFETLASWCAACEIAPSRVLCGEYGAARTSTRYKAASEASRRAYLIDIGAALRKHGFRRSIFALDSPDYGITTGTGSNIGTLDSAIIRAIL